MTALAPLTDHTPPPASGRGVVDMSGSLPTPERLAFLIRSLFTAEGYRGMFADRWARLLGLPLPVVEQVARLPDEGFREAAVRLLRPVAPSVDALVAAHSALGVRRTVVHNPPPTDPGLTNRDLARRVQQWPDHYIGFARFDPARSEACLEEITWCVERAGFRGVSVTPFWHRLPATDPAFEPVYRRCVELDVACYVHTSIHWVTSIPLRHEHPRLIDEVAVAHPDLRIIVGHGGWPWTTELVAVALRHPGVFIELSAFRPSHVATPGTGWDVLATHLGRGLQDKVLYGSTWDLLGRPLADLLGEVEGMELHEDVRDKLLHRNAVHALRLPEEAA